MTSPGLPAARPSYPRPHFSSVPGRKFSITTSASFAMRRTISWPSGRRRSAVTDFLLRFWTYHHSDVPRWSFLHLRTGSPPGGSILITSAPKSAKNFPAKGPAMSCPSSTTFTPARGLLVMTSHRPALDHGLRERSRVHVLELAADGDAACDAGNTQPAVLEHLADIVRGRLALVGEVGRDDHFLDFAASQAPLQHVQADLPGADAIERREAPHEHEIQTVVRESLLHHQQVAGRFDHAQLRGIALGRSAQGAQLLLGEGVALGAAANAFQRPGEGFRELRRARLVALQQVVGGALRRSRADAGNAAQRLDQILERAG